MQKLMGMTVRGKWLVLAASTLLVLAFFGPAGAETAVDKIHFLLLGDVADVQIEEGNAYLAAGYYTTDESPIYGKSDTRTLYNAGLFIVYNEVDERGIGGLPAGREIILKYSHIFDVFN